MTYGGDPLERVHWSEGLLLSPQHFQQQDRFHSAELQLVARSSGGPGWGVADMEFDLPLLSEQTVGLTSFEGVLPDGMVLRLSAKLGNLPRPRATTETFGADRHRVGVYLAVRRDFAGEAGASDAVEPDTRYRLARRDVSDRSAADNVIEVETEVPNARILFDDEERGAYSTIKVGELERGSDGSLRFRDDFVPCCLKIGASKALLERLADLHQKVAARGKALRSRRHQHHATEALFRSADITDFLLLQTLNECEPELAHMVQWSRHEPELAYRVLARTAGRLAPFVDFEPADVPQFRADDLRGCLLPLIQMVARAVSRPSRERCMRLSLESREDGVHFGELGGEAWSHCERFFLAVRSGVDESEVISQLAHLSKVAAWSHISGILAAATPGVAVSVSLRPPAEIPARAGTVYFELEVESPYWAQVLGDRNLAVYLPKPFSPQQTQVELIAVRKEGVQPATPALQAPALTSDPSSPSTHVFTPAQTQELLKAQELLSEGREDALASASGPSDGPAR